MSACNKCNNHLRLGGNRIYPHVCKAHARKYWNPILGDYEIFDYAPCREINVGSEDCPYFVQKVVKDSVFKRFKKFFTGN